MALEDLVINKKLESFWFSLLRWSQLHGNNDLYKKGHFADWQCNGFISFQANKQWGAYVKPIYCTMKLLQINTYIMLINLFHTDNSETDRGLSLQSFTIPTWKNTW